MSKFEISNLIHEKPSRRGFITLVEEKSKKSKKIKNSIIYQLLFKIWIRTRCSEAQNNHCCWCGCETVPYNGKKNSATLEHIVPKSLGGRLTYDNCAMSCHRCNQNRGTLPIEEFTLIYMENKKSND